MTQDLINKDRDLYELFILLTYMRYANIYASMDTLLAYFSELDYSDIYSKLEILRSVVHEAEYNNTDLFSLRSRIFADASLNSLPPNDIGDVIMKFLERVPFCFINRYDTFVKKGYDADLTTLAFKNNIPLGKHFYEMLIEKDEREYNKQQYALFLKRNNLMDEAWQYIDSAYTQCNGHIYSICNTHAMILFENNIDKDEDALNTVENTLDDTFNVLDNCILKDNRKPYHVLTFAKHAVKYYKRYHNEKAINYVLKAINYINEIKELYIPYKARWELKETFHELIRIQHDIQ